MQKLASALYRKVVLFTILCLCYSVSNAQLTADFSATPVAGCAPLVVKFTDQSKGSPTEWKWDLGNGTVSFFQNPSVTYFNPGTYAVKLEVKNASGTHSITKTQYITVYASPTLDITSTGTSGCYPFSITFTDKSKAGDGTINKWLWDFGDGQVENGNASISHTYTTPGEYHVALQATNSFGCTSTKTFQRYVSISDGITPAFTVSAPSSCSLPVSYTFTNTSTGTGNLSYEWDFDDGTTSTDKNPVHSFSVSRNYTIKLLVKNDKGCSTTITQVLKVGVANSTFTAPLVTCVGEQVNFNNTSVPSPVKSTWAFGDGSSSTAIHPIKSFSTAGTYSVTLTNDFGTCQGTVTRQIEVLPPSTADFTADKTTNCQPYTAKFTSSAPDAVSYEWDFGDGKTSTAANPSHTYTDTGFHRVILIITNKAGCKVRVEKKEFIKIRAPFVEIANLPTEGCLPLSVTPKLIIHSVDPIIDYQWNFGDGTTASSLNPTHSYSKVGVYTVTLTYKTQGGCTNTIKVSDGVRVGDKPNVKFSVNPSTTCAADGVQFTDQSTATPPVDRWLWNFGDNLTSTNQNPNHVFDGVGEFDVTLTVYSNGCPNTLTIPDMVHVKPPIAMFSVDLCTDPYTKTFKDLSTLAQTWYWEFGDGKTSTLQNPPPHTYAAKGTYVVKLTVTNGACSFTRSERIHVIDEKITLTVTDDLVCKNTDVTFEIKGADPANIKSYDWVPNYAPSFVGGTTFKQAFANRGTYRVDVSLLDINDCRIPASKEVKVIAPRPDLTALQTAVCINGTITFKDNSTASDPEYRLTKWEVNYGDGNVETVSPPTFQHLYTRGGNYNPTLTVTDNEGCTESVTITSPVIIADPRASFSSPNALSCTTKDIQFVNTSSGTGLTYSWSFGDGTQTSTVANPRVSYATEGAFDIKLTVRDMYGCQHATDSLQYIKIYNPIAKINNSGVFGSCPPLLSNFINDSKNYINQVWDFGDNTSSIERNPNHIYTLPGKYEAVLTVTSHGGCTATDKQSIEVLGPKGTFTYTNLEGCAPVKVIFKGNTNDIATFTWDLNDGNTIATPDATIDYTYTRPGTYLPKMILKDSKGCQVPIPGDKPITVYGITTTLDADKTLLCDNGNVNFTASPVSNDLIQSYTWSLGDGTTITNTDRNFPHTYKNTGNYPVRLTVTTAHNCSVDAMEAIKVVQSPKARIAGPDPACVPANLQFNGILDNTDTSSFFKWEWEFANGQQSAAQNPSLVQYNKDGTYKVALKLTNSSGCTDEVFYDAVIHPLPKTNAGADFVLCVDQSKTLQATGAQRYVWTPASSLSCTDCPNPVTNTTGTITYKVEGIDTYGSLQCKATDEVIVTVQQRFTVAVNKGDTLCIGEKYSIQASGADLYQWTPATGLNNATSDRPIANPTATTLYTVTGSDRNGCFTSTATVPVIVYPYPTLELGPNKEINVGYPVVLNPTLSADVKSILWTPSVGLSCNDCPSPTASPKQTTTYKVQVENEGRCITEDNITLYAVCKGENMYLPNTFSPNGDSFNETFFPRGRGLASVKTFRIYNRWGETVFESKNFQVNDASKGWNGMYKGKAASSDAYVYIIEVICENNEVLMFKGDVTLLR